MENVILNIRFHGTLIIKHDSTSISRNISLKE
jgi:hypothetical protein